MSPRNGRKRLTPEQKQILHDGVVFAVKLWLDSIKDFALGFLALGAALVDLIKGRQPGGFLFYKVMKLGHRLDHVIDVYSMHEEPDSLPGTKEPFNRNGD